MTSREKSVDPVRPTVVERPSDGRRGFLRVAEVSVDPELEITLRRIPDTEGR